MLNGSFKYLFEGMEIPRKFQGAGLFIIHPDTKKILLLKRNEAHPSWCIVGGGVEANETHLCAAKREAMEEMGIGSDKYDVINENTGIADYVNSNPNIDYHTYIAGAKELFEPKLNDEHTEHGWFTKDELPTPLHFGVMAFLNNTGILEKL